MVNSCLCLRLGESPTFPKSLSRQFMTQNPSHSYQNQLKKQPGWKWFRNYFQSITIALHILIFLILINHMLTMKELMISTFHTICCRSIYFICSIMSYMLYICLWSHTPIITYVHAPTQSPHKLLESIVILSLRSSHIPNFYHARTNPSLHKRPKSNMFLYLSNNSSSNPGQEKSALITIWYTPSKINLWLQNPDLYIT